MNITIESSWRAVLGEYLDTPEFARIAEFVGEQYLSGYKTIYPQAQDIFRAFALCPFDQVRVVILGQDPYHGPNQAHGLAFSVLGSTAIPPSLRNIFNEILDDTGKESISATSGNLEPWAKQGVLLLNSVLTVESGEANSHADQGWENFSSEVIKQISQKHEHVVFMLWGAYAQKKGEIIDSRKHLVLKAPHPSPLSAHRGFFGSRHFSQTNTYLNTHNHDPIDW